MQLTERHLIKPNHKLYNVLDDLTFKALQLSPLLLILRAWFNIGNIRCVK